MIFAGQIPRRGAKRAPSRNDSISPSPFEGEGVRRAEEGAGIAVVSGVSARHRSRSPGPSGRDAWRHSRHRTHPQAGGPPSGKAVRQRRLTAQ